PARQSHWQEPCLLCARTNPFWPVLVLCCDPVSQSQRFPGHRSSHDRERKATIQAMEKSMKARKIPSTDSIEELARFWDRHDLTDFEDQLEEVTAPVFTRRLTTAVTVRLRPDEANEIKRVAKTKRVREATLIRRWVIEKLHATGTSSRRH